MKKQPYFYKRKDEKDWQLTWAHNLKEAIEIIRMSPERKNGIYQIWHYEKDEKSIQEESYKKQEDKK